MRALPVRGLQRWFEGARRELPWRRRRTPWRVWVAEVMLQQTTVPVVLRRYEEFLRRYPKPELLAAADDPALLAAWAGLGYYRRARALRSGAAAVCERHGGRVPRAEQDLLALPGVGAYTAAAIRAFAFDLPAAVIDANVARVLARWMGHAGPVSGRAFRGDAEALLLAARPESWRDFSEALMELGALVCKPTEAHCTECPLAKNCVARGNPMAYPAAVVRKKSEQWDSLRLLVQRAGGVVMVQRPADAELLPGFWELPGAWVPAGSGDDPQALQAVLAPLGFTPHGAASMVCEARHTITHRRLRCRLMKVPVRGRLRSGDLVNPRVPGRPVTTESVKLLQGSGLA